MFSEGTVSPAAVHSVFTVNITRAREKQGELAITDLLQEFIDITTPNPVADTTTTVQHYISTASPPVFERPRRLTVEKLIAAREDFDLMLHTGSVRPSRSQWASPLHMVRKKNGVDWRATGDYRLLNAQTVPDRYPIPFIEDIFQRLHSKKKYSQP